VLSMTWEDGDLGLLPVLSAFETKNVRMVDGDIISETGGPVSSVVITYILSGIEVGQAELGPFSAVLIDPEGAKADSVSIPAISIEFEEASQSRIILIVIPIVVVAIVIFGVLALRRKEKLPDEDSVDDEDILAELDSLYTAAEPEQFLIRSEACARQLVSKHLEIDVSNLTAREIVEELSRKGSTREQMAAADTFFSNLQDVRFSDASSSQEKLGAILFDLKDLVGTCDK